MLQMKYRDNDFVCYINYINKNCIAVDRNDLNIQYLYSSEFSKNWKKFVPLFIFKYQKSKNVLFLYKDAQEINYVE